jgi:arsenate reductase (thioredoxin)
MTRRATILFLCVHNAGRSQMAAAFARMAAGDDVVVLSAGSEPARELNPAVLAAMRERGIDLAGQVPTLLSEGMAQVSDVVVTMGCGDACPVYPGKRYVDWDLDDPAGHTVEEVRPIRDEIERRVRALLGALRAESNGGVDEPRTPPSPSGPS